MTKTERADAFGWFFGILSFVAMMLVVITFSESQWHHEIARAKTHHPGWVVREGTVTQTKQANFGIDPPARPSIVTFEDFYGKTQQVWLNMPYRAQVGDSTQVDVKSDGSIYAPNTVDTFNQVYDNPLAATSDGFWPAPGILLGGVIAIFIAIGLGLLGAAVVEEIPSARGRLGTR